MIQRRAAVALIAALALAGCARLSVPSGPPAARPAGRTLVLARAADVENAPIVDEAAAMLGEALRASLEVVGPRTLVREADAGTLVWLPSLLTRMHGGAWPTFEESQALVARFRVPLIVAAEVTAYDQVWGKYGKFTRVGIAAHVFDTAAATPVLTVYRDIEVEDMRGRAFRYALERVVGDIAAEIGAPRSVSIVDTWRFWRR
jgi:hypothetical protein